MPTGTLSNSTDFSLITHLASSTLPEHLMSIGFPSSILIVRISSSGFGPGGVNVILAEILPPEGTTSSTYAGTNMPELPYTHFILAGALPLLVMSRFSAMLMSMQSLGNVNFKFFLSISRFTGSA